MTSPDPLPALLAPFWDRPGEAAILTDFDGTLAAIVDHPADARPLPGVREVLRSLAARYATVCVVSGRPVGFLRDQLGDSAARLVGSYGLEWVEGGEVVVAEEADAWRAAVEDAAAAAERGGPPGVLVERKGLSVTLHFRVSPGAREAVEDWATNEARRTGLAVHPARESFELRPPIARDKGDVVAEVVDGMGAACFLGDDRGDLPAFDALDRAAERGASVLRVGVRSEEAPPELLERADLRVDGPDGALELLRRLLG